MEKIFGYNVATDLDVEPIRLSVYYDSEIEFNNFYPGSKDWDILTKTLSGPDHHKEVVIKFGWNGFEANRFEAYLFWDQQKDVFGLDEEWYGEGNFHNYEILEISAVDSNNGSLYVFYDRDEDCTYFDPISWYDKDLPPFMPVRTVNFWTDENGTSFMRDSDLLFLPGNWGFPLDAMKSKYPDHDYQFNRLESIYRWVDEEGSIPVKVNIWKEYIDEKGNPYDVLDKTYDGQLAAGKAGEEPGTYFDVITSDGAYAIAFIEHEFQDEEQQ